MMPDTGALRRRQSRQRRSATSVTASATLGGSTTFAEDKTVTVSVGSGTATEGTDFVAVADFTRTIAAGASSGSATFDLDPTQDNLDKPDETVAVGATASSLTVTAGCGVR